MFALNQTFTPCQVHGREPEVWSQILLAQVNLAVWQREVPDAVSAFCAQLLSQGKALSESHAIDIHDNLKAADLVPLASAYSDLDGYQDFLADVSWLVAAYGYLLGARRVGLRLRALDQSMYPRFHVDHVPVRLITTYSGVASQWLAEGAMSRARLGDPHAEPTDPALIQQLMPGDVALLKGEKWLGNEGAAIIHRSPPPPEGTRRLLLTVDWLQ